MHSGESKEGREPRKSKRINWKDLEDVRRIVEFLKGKLGSYPLARAKIKTIGDQFVTDETGDGLINAEMGQRLLEFALEMTDHLEYDEEGLVRTWYPKEDKTVRLAEGMRFGVPIVPSGVSTAAIHDRKKAGEDDTFIAEWFGIKMSEVKAALEFEREWQAVA